MAVSRKPNPTNLARVNETWEYAKKETPSMQKMYAKSL